MITTLTGENSYALDAELHRLESEFLQEYGELALERIDGQEAEYHRIYEAVTSLPFLAAKKMVVLRSPSSNKQFAENIEQIIDAVGDETDLIVVEPKLDKRSLYYKLLKKLTDFKEYSALDPQGLARWINEEVKRQGGTISVADAHYLVDRIGIDQQLLSKELEKLLLFDKAISRKSIDELTDPNPQSTIFQLMEAAFGGNSRRTMDLYMEQRAQHVEPPQIIAMLTWQLHILALIKAANGRSADQIASQAKISPYVVRKSQTIANKISLTDLKQLIAELMQLDVNMKTTAIDADQALQHYLMNVAERV